MALKIAGDENVKVGGFNPLWAAVANLGNITIFALFRFLLHLAEKTDGIIVTNDNLKDFLNTSETWRKIIQER